LTYSQQLTQFVADLAADENQTPEEYLAHLATEFEADAAEDEEDQDGTSTNDADPTDKPAA
jgi:hypothetical protein